MKYSRWTRKEEDTLVCGVQMHGAGKWKQILQEGAGVFVGRTNVDLKDKWRTVSFQERLRSEEQKAGEVLVSVEDPLMDISVFRISLDDYLD